MKRYYLPTKIYFGSGMLKNLPGILGQKKQRIYLVIDNYFFKKGLDQVIKDLFPETKIEVFNVATPNPKLAQAEELRNKIKEFNAELVIAVGGGSTLDTGKSAAILLNHSHDLMGFLEKKMKLHKKGIPFVAIPTTAGTGSEVTPWSTIWKDKIK